jgi:hypothetical protein
VALVLEDGMVKNRKRGRIAWLVLLLTVSLVLDSASAISFYVEYGVGHYRGLPLPDDGLAVVTRKVVIGRGGIMMQRSTTMTSQFINIGKGRARVLHADDSYFYWIRQTPPSYPSYLGEPGFPRLGIQWDSGYDTLSFFIAPLWPISLVLLAPVVWLGWRVLKDRRAQIQ